MALGDTPKKLPVSSFFNSLTEWSGWEYIYEERRKVAAVTLLILFLILGAGYLISKKQSSSLGKLVQAESLVAKITDSSTEEPEASIQKDVDTLFSLSSDPIVLSQFCGVLAQEEILAKKKEIQPDFFDAVSQDVSQQGSPILNNIMQLTLLQKKGSWEEALKTVEELKAMSNTPWFSLYILIQKARILAALERSNAQVIEEMRSMARGIESRDDFFETWLNQNANDFFDSLTKN